MRQAQDRAVVCSLSTIFHEGVVAGLTDGQLLERFASGANPAAEAAFEALVSRHQRLVYGVCRRILGDVHEAEDAFQATFLVLARKARALWFHDSLGPWLYRVAWRTAMRQRAATARWPRSATAPELIRAAGGESASDDELGRLVHDEIARLPEKYRAALVICYLEGRTCEEAARQLRCPVGTIKIRLMRGRERLRATLRRRGVVPSIAALGIGMSARTANAAPVGLAKATARAAVVGGASGHTAFGTSRPAMGALWAPILLAAVGIAGLTTALIDRRSVGSLALSLRAATPSPYVSIDIERQANHGLDNSLEGLPDNDLASLPRGEQVLAGVPFRVGERLIHLRGLADSLEPNLPRVATGLSVLCRVRRLHVLHATQFGEEADPIDEGTVVATLVIRYADGTEARAPVIYGRDVRDWWYHPDRPEQRSATVAWTGTNPSARGQDQAIRLYKMTWENTASDRIVASIDIVSAQTVCEPLVVALTFEPL